MDCQDGLPRLYRRIGRPQEGTALTARGTRGNPASQERRLHEQRHCQSNRMFTNHRWKRAKARHTTPKEQQGQEARILGKAWRSGLQGEQKAFSETTPNLSLHSFHSLDNGTGQRTQVVFGCLRRICSSAQAVFSRGDGLHPHALQ